jgi:hypothetical protein
LKTVGDVWDQCTEISLMKPTVTSGRVYPDVTPGYGAVLVGEGCNSPTQSVCLSSDFMTYQQSSFKGVFLSRIATRDQSDVTWSAKGLHGT